MKTRQITLGETWFPSLPRKEIECTLDGKKITRAEFMHLRSLSVKDIANEQHSAAGKTVRWIICEIPD